MGLLNLAEETAANAVVPGAGALIHIGRWFGRHWQTIVVVVAIGAVALLIWKAPWAYTAGAHSRDKEVVDLQQQLATLRAADAKAQADAVENARRIDAAQMHAKENENATLQSILAAARADAVAYAARLRSSTAGATEGNGQQRAAGSAGGAAGAVAGAGAMSVLDDGDLRICTENTVKALSWPSWWHRLQAIPR